MIRITAKFNSYCANSGRKVKKGEIVYYDRSQKKVFHLDTVDEKQEEKRDPAAGMIQANEEAYFDNFCQQNGI